MGLFGTPLGDEKVLATRIYASENTHHIMTCYNYEPRVTKKQNINGITLYFVPTSYCDV